MKHPNDLGLNEEYDSQITKLITGPLKNVIGKPLHSVVYYVLHSDYLDFDADATNTSGGCQGMRLIFADGEVELDWDWQSVFRPSPDDYVSEPIAYHLVARPASERQASMRISTENDYNGLSVIEATEANPWKHVRGETLLSVAVWGTPLSNRGYSPQAAELLFPSAQVVVTIGMTSPLSIGGGDEVLVFTKQHWTQRLFTYPKGWLVPFWWVF